MSDVSRKDKIRSEVSAELTGPIVAKSTAAKRIAYAAVLVPGEPDSDGDVLTAEKIEEVAHDWLANYRNVDLQHSLNNVAVPVESHVLDADKVVEFAGKSVTLPKGTWILGSRLDEATWDAVEKGDLTGYSVMGVKRKAIEAATKNEAALKRTMLKDLGEDWIAPFVSVVDAPAVPKAKFYALKEAPKPSLLGRMFGVARKNKTGEGDMDEKQISEMINAGVADAIEAQQEAIGQMVSDAVGKAIEAQKIGDTVEAVKTEISERLEKVEKAQAEKSRVPDDDNTTAAKAEEPDRDVYGDEIRRDGFGRRI